MKKFIFLLLIFFTPSSSFAGNLYNIEIVRVLDGDTVEARILVFPEVEVHTKIRINGVDAPELHPRIPTYLDKQKREALKQCEKSAAQKAKLFVENTLSSAKSIQVAEVSFGKYAGRYLATILVDENSLTNLLLQSGNGREYHGGRRTPWCLK